MAGIRALGVLLEVLMSAGFESSYAYDDLVFIENSPFLLRFDANEANKLYYYVNKDMDQHEVPKLFSSVEKALSEASFIIVNKGSFMMDNSNAEKESVEIEFYEAC